MREGLVVRCEEVLRETVSRGKRRGKILDGKGGETRVSSEPVPVHPVNCGHG